MRAVPVHYLRPNEAEWTPSCVAVFDTETDTTQTITGELLTLRLWCAQLTDRRPTRSGKRQTLRGRGHTGGQLVDWLEKVMTGRESLWLYAHNLGFDLVTTRLPLRLRDAGWQITEAAVAGHAPWFRFAKGRKHITLVDSWSWLPYPLAEVAKAVGSAKLDLPDQADGDDAWFARCDRDVEVTTAAMLELMAWWDRHKLGRWNLTGPASGWNVMRHLPKDREIVIDPDPDLVRFERAAVYGGRRGTWRVGSWEPGPFFEVDFAAAYPTVAANLPLPWKRSHPFDALPPDDFRLDCERWGVIAEVEVETDVPRWPLRTPDGTLYPVGRFVTTLAGPDVAEAKRLGCLRRVGPGWAYRLDTALRQWAQWCLAAQAGQPEDTPRVAQLVAKSWGRTVIGKFAARATTVVKLGPSPHRDWHVEEGWDHDAGCKGTLVDLAGERFWAARDDTGENTFPAVLAFVEAHVRTRLNRALEALGPSVTLQCDTDGILVDGRKLRPPATGRAARGGPRRSPRALAGRALDDLADLVAPLVMRVKAEHASVTVLGPQHLVVGGRRRYSGLPSHATQTSPGRFVVHQWPGLTWQLAHGDRAGYVRPKVEPKIVGPFPTGWLLDDGAVVPPMADVTPDGETVLYAWSQLAPPYVGARLSDTQHRALATLETGWKLRQIGA